MFPNNCFFKHIDRPADLVLIVIFCNEKWFHFDFLLLKIYHPNYMQIFAVQHFEQKQVPCTFKRSLNKKNIVFLFEVHGF